MRLLFSEFDPDYSCYRYPYIVYGLPEPGETPADLYEAGFHPASAMLDRFVLCRHLRLPLAGFQPSSENRRILRKGEGLQLELVERAAFAYTDEVRARWLAFAEARFGPGIMPAPRLDGLMAGRVVTHVLVARDPAADGREVGAVLLYLEPPRMAHYYYAFYDLAGRERNLGMFLMTRAVEFFRAAGVQRLFLGTCYSERALYKTQFAGLEFHNGIRWTADLAQLRLLLRREADARHALEEPEFLQSQGGWEGMRASGGFSVTPS